MPVPVHGGGLAKLAHCHQSLGFLFQAHQLIDCTLNHIVLTLEACWMPYKRPHGSVGDELQIL